MMRKTAIGFCFLFLVSTLALIVRSQTPSGGYVSPLGGGTTSGASIVTACSGTANMLIKINSAGTGCANSSVTDNATTVSTAEPIATTSTLSTGGVGTGNGVVNLLGNTSGTATITAPAVAGTAGNPIVSSNSVKLPAGSAAATALQFPDGANFGFFDGGSNIIAVANGHDAMAWRDVDISAMPSQGNLGWTATSGDPTAALDTNLSRGGAGIVNVGTGTAASAAGQLNAAVLNPTATTVAGLPAAAAGNKGFMKVVSDSTTVAVEGQTCIGSGAITALAFSNGTVWKCF